jgi:hypothetical protein
MLHFDIVNTLLSLTGNVLTLQFVLFVALYIPYRSSSTPINVVIITDCNNLLGTVTYAVFYKAFSGLILQSGRCTIYSEEPTASVCTSVLRME